MALGVRALSQMVVEPMPFHGTTTGRATDGHEESDMRQVAPPLPNSLVPKDRLTVAWSMCRVDADVEMKFGSSLLEGESTSLRFLFLLGFLP